MDECTFKPNLVKTQKLNLKVASKYLLKSNKSVKKTHLDSICDQKDPKLGKSLQNLRSFLHSNQLNSQTQTVDLSQQNFVHDYLQEKVSRKSHSPNCTANHYYNIVIRTQSQDEDENNNTQIMRNLPAAFLQSVFGDESCVTPSRMR